jgi:hypothetical protein
MLVAPLAASGATFLAASLILGYWGQPRPAFGAALMVPACGLAVGFIEHGPVTISVSVAALASLIWLWWRPPRHRKRVQKFLGNKEKAIRARLVAAIPRGRRAPSPQQP